MSVQSAGSTKTVSHLQSLMQPAAKSKTTGVSDPLAALFAAFTGGKADKADEADAADESPASGNSGCPQFSHGTMASLIAIQGQQATNTTSLLGQFDTDDNGAISQSEFENAIGPSADKSQVDSLFGKIDTDSDSTINPDELQAAIDKAQQSQIARHGHHHQMGGAGASGPNGLPSLLSPAAMTGATTQTTSNADGSTTTMISYADGTKLTLSVPASTGSEPSTGNSDKPGNPLASMKSFLEKLMQLQTQLLAQQVQQTTTAVMA
jgi:hypothetical protein